METKMKNSGIQWIGEIPEHWTCCKQKYLITLLNGRAYKENEFEEDGKYKILRVGNLFTNPVWYTSSLELETDKYCQEGDLLYSWSMSYAPVIWHGDKVIYHYHIWKTVLSDQINKMFAYYYFISLTKALQSEVHETTMGFITMGIMNNAFVPLPPLSEQEAIANFLDGKCAEIDQLRTDIEQEIKVLQEYKKSIIAETVTHGLNPSAPTKDSGLAWIGEIPEHWEVKRFKYCFQLSNGLTFTKSELVDEGNAVVSYGQVHAKYNSRTHLSDDLIRYIPDTIVKGRSGAKLKLHDFVFADTSEDLAGCGNAIYIDRDIPIYAGYHTIIARPIIIGDIKYLAYLFNTEQWREQIREKVSGVKVNSITKSILQETKLLLPPPSEQEAIAIFLDGKCAAIDAAIQTKKDQLESLDAYKSSLIYEYVTGKKQVI